METASLQPTRQTTPAAQPLPPATDFDTLPSPCSARVP